MGSFSGKQLLYFHSCLHSLWGSTLGEKNLLLGSKFFPLRVDPPFFPFERAALCKKGRQVMGVVSLCKNDRES